MYQALLTLFKNPRIFAPILFLAGTGFVVLGSHVSSPLFSSVDQFVLFADQGITLEDNTQVSSGNIGSNSDLTLDKNVLISGDLFADKITLAKGAEINGNASYNKLRSASSTQILGTQTKPIQLPVANLPILPEFTLGTTSLTVTGTSTILSPNSYRDITLSSGSTLTLLSGSYTLRSLELNEDSTLIFTGTTTLNIQRALKGENHVSILPGLHTHHDQLTINYNGFKEKNVKTRDHFDDDKDASDTFDNDRERKDWQKGTSAQPITFGERAFLNFRLIAPRASVTIGKESIVRGQVVAGKIKVKKDSFLSRSESFAFESDPTKIVEVDGAKFIGNEVLIGLTIDGQFADAQMAANAVGGRVVGFDPNPPLYQILLPTATVAGVESALRAITDLNNLRIVGVSTNYILE
jgi:hypothetical protein